MNLCTTYRVEHATHAKYLSSLTYSVEDAYWSSDDDFVIEFDDEDDAIAAAEKFDGEVQRVQRWTQIGNSSRYLLGAGKGNL